MRSPLWTAAVAAALTATSHLAAATNSTCDCIGFNATHILTATVILGPPPPGFNENPITVPGGILVPEAILGGTVEGPVINGNISSGLATPRVYRNGTLQVPVIDVYGVTDEGVPFALHETGIGSPMAQMTRLEVSIGGGEQYDVLNTGYILATVNPNAQRTEVHVMGYLVENNVGAQEM